MIITLMFCEIIFIVKCESQISPVQSSRVQSSLLFFFYFLVNWFHSYHFLLFPVCRSRTSASLSMSETPRKENGKNLPSTTVGTPKLPPTSQAEIMAVARNFADQPLQNPDPGVWAVLTAISKKSRQRSQVYIALDITSFWKWMKYFANMFIKI